jgi:uncharacterized membrane protein YgcG
MYLASWVYTHYLLQLLCTAGYGYCVYTRRAPLRLGKICKGHVLDIVVQDKQKGGGEGGGGGGGFGGGRCGMRGRI